jgi:GDP-L-fucose synthase
MNILITGANGYIGKSLFNALKNEHNVTPLRREDVDLINPTSVDKFFYGKYFDVVIHCAVSGGKRTDIDDSDTLDNNLKMYYNLLSCGDHFNKFIYFGSGAEEHNTFYGLSKKAISKSIQNKDNFYNLRIFAVFDENELDTRFIKTNIKKYINGKPIEIFRNRQMDFFYMEDLVTLVKHYIFNDNLPKEINCCYSYSLYLSDIAIRINDMSYHNVYINILNSPQDNKYTGKFTDLGLRYVGLEQGIKNVYNNLKNEY